MGVKGKAMKRRHGKKTNRRRIKLRPGRDVKAKARDQSSWLTVLSEDGETSESEDEFAPIRRK
jgi:hypothetical protein